MSNAANLEPLSPAERRRMASDREAELGYNLQERERRELLREIKLLRSKLPVGFDLLAERVVVL